MVVIWDFCQLVWFIRVCIFVVIWVAIWDDAVQLRIENSSLVQYFKIIFLIMLLLIICTVLYSFMKCAQIFYKAKVIPSKCRKLQLSKLSYYDFLNYFLSNSFF
jgi:UDP-N-acetylmuramyl pentapeptide phosphotransferase/UDP-N-acetylglucosamine-1-phosphate transferase